MIDMIYLLSRLGAYDFAVHINMRFFIRARDSFRASSAKRLPPPAPATMSMPFVLTDYLGILVVN